MHLWAAGAAGLQAGAYRSRRRCAVTNHEVPPGCRRADQGRALPVQLFFLAAVMEATAAVDPRMATMDTPFQRCRGAIPTASDLSSLVARAQQAGLNVNYARKCVS